MSTTDNFSAFDALTRGFSRRQWLRAAGAAGVVGAAGVAGRHALAAGPLRNLKVSDP